MITFQEARRAIGYILLNFVTHSWCQAVRESVTRDAKLEFWIHELFIS